MVITVYVLGGAWDDAYTDASRSLKQKRYIAALPAAKKAVEIADRESPKSDERYGKSRFLLAEIQLHSDEAQRAKLNFEIGLRHLRNAFGEGDPRLAIPVEKYAAYRLGLLIATLDKSDASIVPGLLKIKFPTIFELFGESRELTINAFGEASIEAKALRERTLRHYNQLTRAIRIAANRRGSLKDERARDTQKQIKRYLHELEKHIAALKRSGGPKKAK